MICFLSAKNPLVLQAGTMPDLFYPLSERTAHHGLPRADGLKNENISINT